MSTQRSLTARQIRFALIAVLAVVGMAFVAALGIATLAEVMLGSR